MCRRTGRALRRNGEGSIAGSLGRLSRKLASYSASLAVGAVINVVTIPLIISSAGASLWAEFAVAQAIGTIVSLVAAAGWGLTGPADVVRRGTRDRGLHFLESSWARMYLFIALLPLACVALALFRPTNLPMSLVMLLAVSFGSLGASWYFIGESSPGRLFWIDTMPRVIGSVLGVTLLAITRDAWWYVALYAVGAFATVVVPVITIPRRTGVGYGEVSLAPRRSIALLVEQRAAMLTAASTAIQINLPIVLVASVAPRALIEYALAEKVYKFAQNALSPVVQVVQGWRMEFGDAQHRQRLQQIMLSVSAFGLLLGAGVALLLPLASRYLSAGRAEISWSVSIAFGAGLAVVTLSRVVSYAFLMALGARREVARGAVVSTVVGLPAVALFAFLFGAAGAAWALTLSEAAALAYQLVVLKRELRTVTLIVKPIMPGALSE